MTESNRYTQYGYNPYQQQPQQGEPSSAGLQRSRFEQRRQSQSSGITDFLTSKLRNPLSATVALVAVGVVFAGVIVLSYPSGNESSEMPVVKAQEISSFKVQPDEAGGMAVPHQESTIFDVAAWDDSGSSNSVTGRKIENLLAPEEPVEDVIVSASAQSEQVEEPVAKVESLLKKATPPQSDELQQVASAEDVQAPVEPEAVSRTETKAEPVKPERLHAAGSSPETIAFVRSVLDEKDEKTAAASLNSIEPASGGDAINAPSTVSAITPGSYYVQLGSVSSDAGAHSEWSKMQKSLPITGLDYRVQEANLGARGTFYRIQAGPVSKDSADSLCSQIKAQKPGGCLVVK